MSLIEIFKSGIFRVEDWIFRQGKDESREAEPPMEVEEEPEFDDEEEVEEDDLEEEAGKKEGEDNGKEKVAV